jgi:hypothetical protein
MPKRWCIDSAKLERMESPKNSSTRETGQQSTDLELHAAMSAINS